MSALSNVNGLWYRYDAPGSGRFLPLSMAPGDCDGILCVTGPSDPENTITQALNAAALIPAGSTRWIVAYQALKSAYQNGTKLALYPGLVVLRPVRPRFSPLSAWLAARGVGGRRDFPRSRGLCRGELPAATQPPGLSERAS